jgi:hypothetical protein
VKVADENVDLHDRTPGDRTYEVHGGVSGFAQEIVVSRHRLMPDEPEAQGGTDTGASSYDYLLVAD